MNDFERRYNSLILNKVTKVEDFVNEIALEQARLLERFILLRSYFLFGDNRKLAHGIKEKIISSKVQVPIA